MKQESGLGYASSLYSHEFCLKNVLITWLLFDIYCSWSVKMSTPAYTSWFHGKIFNTYENYETNSENLLENGYEVTRKVWEVQAIFSTNHLCVGCLKETKFLCATLRIQRRRYFPLLFLCGSRSISHRYRYIWSLKKQKLVFLEAL